MIIFTCFSIANSLITMRKFIDFCYLSDSVYELLEGGLFGQHVVKWRLSCFAALWHSLCHTCQLIRAILLQIDCRGAGHTLWSYECSDWYYVSTFYNL
jgi:hypothetical protein